MDKDPKIEQWKAKGTYVSMPQAGGIKVYAQEIGNSEASPDQTLLLLHGFPESSFSFHLVTEGLQDRFERIILLDFPGFGLSDKPRVGYAYSLLAQADVVLEVWKHLGIRGGHLLGHDMGDSVVTELVAREVEGKLPPWFSAGFQSYTFTNGSMVLELAELRIIQKLLLTSFGSVISRISSKGIFQQQVKSAHGEAPLEKSEINRLWAMHSFKGGRAITHLTIKYLLDRKRYESVRWLPALTQTDIPIHICWGNKDAVAKVEMAHYLKEKICPQAQLTLMEGVGHFCQMGSPDIWLTKVLAFFCQHSG